MNNKLKQLLTKYPSYFKCGNDRIAKRVQCSPVTVEKFKKSEWFISNKRNYC